jgi:hypothetical protein
MSNFIKRRVYSGTLLNTTPIEITPGKGFTGVDVRNISPDYDQNILVSVDGTNYHEVPQNTELDFPLQGDTLYVKTDTANAKYNIVMDTLI